MARRGAQVEGHKYTRRIGTPGHYTYVYPRQGGARGRARAAATTAAQRRAPARTAARPAPAPRVAARATVRSTVAPRPRAIETPAAKAQRIQRAAGLPSGPLKINVGPGVDLTTNRRALTGNAAAVRNAALQRQVQQRIRARMVASNAVRPTASPDIAPPAPAGRPKLTREQIVADEKLAASRARARRAVELHEQTIRQREVAHQLRTQGTIQRQQVNQAVAQSRIARLEGRARYAPARAGLVGRTVRGSAKIALIGVGAAAVGAVAVGTTKVWVGRGTVANVRPDGTVASTEAHKPY